MLSTLTLAVLLTAIRPTADHRLRRIARTPHCATSDDVDHLLRAHGVNEPKVWAVGDYLALAQIPPALVWQWVMEYDGIELTELLATDLTDAELLDHLQRGTSPVYAEQRVA